MERQVDRTSLRAENAAACNADEICVSLESWRQPRRPNHTLHRWLPSLYVAPMIKRDRPPTLEEDICIHIFTVSAAMVGVCLTVIGLLRLVISLQHKDTLGDDLLACDAILFLTSCLSSYWALRTRSVQRMPRLERFADAVFVIAMCLMVFMCAFIALSIAVS